MISLIKKSPLAFIMISFGVFVGIITLVTQLVK